MKTRHAALPPCTLALMVILLPPAPPVHAVEKRLLTIDDLYQMREVDDPQVSPDGEWVAYTVRTSDLKEDKRNRDLWMTRWDGTTSVQLTFGEESEHTPRWSPDGQYLAFLSDRENAREEDQLWILSRAGGEARKITDFKGEVSDYAWAPDGRRLALIVEDPDPDAPDPDDPKSKDKTPKPIVIDRFQFKLDEEGYLKKLHQHLYLFDLDSRKAEIFTPGEHDEVLPSWSPDGRSIAFATKRGADPDRHDNWDLYVIEARAGASARQLTTYDGPDSDPSWESRPAWSPDGKSIAYLQGGPQKLIYYAVHQLAVVPAAGGPPRLLAPKLDRNVGEPRWSEDGASILFLLEDDGRVELARVPAAGGKAEALAEGNHVDGHFSLGRGGRIAVLRSTPQQPSEVFALDSGPLRSLTRHNDPWLEEVRLGAVDSIRFRSKDGTEIHGFVVKPPEYQAGLKYPTVLRIHGGPVSQFQHEFEFDWQLFAAHGYAVVAANPRGSSGRGEAFSKAIYADWGNKDAQDVLAAVDRVVSMGIADPERLGVGGWSYGGMLTNYTIARDRRFKAAVSGASISNILAGYGTDQYVREYEAELGTPWRATEVWLRNSYPFLHADRIVTPTLFMCGSDDFNVPLLNSEQMYQALRSLGLDTQLVIYPGQYHGLRKPSYLKDRLERGLAWYDRHLRPRGPSLKQVQETGG